LAKHVPGTAVLLYGSLVMLGRFHDRSDGDVSLESLPAGMTLEYLQSLLSQPLTPAAEVCVNPNDNRPTDRTLALPRDTQFVLQVSQSH